MVARPRCRALTRPQPGGQTIGTIAGVTDGTSNTVCFFERNRGSNNGGSGSAKPGDVYTGRPGSQWGMPTYVISNPADFTFFTTQSPPGLRPVRPGESHHQHLDLWRAMVDRRRVHQLGRELQPDPQQQVSPTARPGAASGPASGTSRRGAITRAASTSRCPTDRSGSSRTRSTPQTWLSPGDPERRGSPQLRLVLNVSERSGLNAARPRSSRLRRDCSDVLDDGWTRLVPIPHI